MYLREFFKDLPLKPILTEPNLKRFILKHYYM